MGAVCCSVHKQRDAELASATARERRYWGKMIRGYLKAAKNLRDAWYQLAPSEREAAYQAVLNLPWREGFEQPLLQAWQDMAGEVLVKAGNAQLAELGISLSFTVDNPFSQAWVREHSSTMIRGITTETRSAVVAELDALFREGVGPKRIAPRVGQIVGLDRRFARAVANRESVITAQGASESSVARQVERYRNRLLRARGERIARTETVAAHGQGVLDSWRVAQSEGFLGPQVKKMWIAAVGSKRTCKICLGINGQKRLISEPFISSIGPVMRPGAHVGCRCTMGLVFE